MLVVSNLTSVCQHLANLQTLLDIPLYLVGGSLRDLLLGREYADIDLATPAKPAKILTVFKSLGWQLDIGGLAFGSLGFAYDFGDSGQATNIQITTFRQDTYRPQSRYPQIDFVTDIFLDLPRRDFTINAMALDAQGKLYDPCDGQSDLDVGLIRTIGDPDLKLSQDPVRILRAIRFSALLQFTIEPKTLQSIHIHKPSLAQLSRATIDREYLRLCSLLGRNSADKLLTNFGLYEIIQPKLIE